jgi:hypothetical protein
MATALRRTLLPAFFHLTERASVGPRTMSHLDERLSFGGSVALLVVYALFVFAFFFVVS